MKAFLTTLFALIILLGNAIQTCAAEVPMETQVQSRHAYPIAVNEYVEDGEYRIDKIYQLSLSEDPSVIPIENFERNGRTYTLLDVLRKDEVGVDTQPYTETITQDSKNGKLADVLKELDAQKEITTEDGYTGVLLLDAGSVTVEAKGYKTATKNITATRTYPNLSEADTSLVPKSIENSGNTLTLADVQWSPSGGEESEQHWTATATYTGTSNSRYATGYTVTANYSGEVVKNRLRNRHLYRHVCQPAGRDKRPCGVRSSAGTVRGIGTDSRADGVHGTDGGSRNSGNLGRFVLN